MVATMIAAARPVAITAIFEMLIFFMLMIFNGSSIVSDVPRGVGGPHPTTNSQFCMFERLLNRSILGSSIRLNYPPQGIDWAYT
jgi:hypothetical protein